MIPLSSATPRPEWLGTLGPASLQLAYFKPRTSGETYPIESGTVLALVEQRRVGDALIDVFAVHDASASDGTQNAAAVLVEPVQASWQFHIRAVVGDAGIRRALLNGGAGLGDAGVAQLAARGFRLEGPRDTAFAASPLPQ